MTMSAICAIENRTAVGALELRSKILKRAKWLRLKRALFTVRKLAPGSGCHVGVIRLRRRSNSSIDRAAGSGAPSLPTYGVILSILFGFPLRCRSEVDRALGGLVEPIRFPAQEPIRFPAQRPANVALPRHYDSHLRSIFRKHARGFDLISPFRGAGLVSAKPPSIRGGPLAIWDRSPRQPVARRPPHACNSCVFPRWRS